MSDRIEIQLGLDTTEAEADLREFQQAVDTVGRETAKRMREIRTEMGRVVGIARGIAGAVQGILKAMGVTLDPIQEAMIATLLAGLQMVMTISAMATATVVGAPFGIALAIIGFALFAMAQTATALKMNEVNRGLRDAENIIGSLTSAMYSLGV